MTLKLYKHVHVLVNNAGIINELNPQRVIEINVLGVNNGCRTALKYLGKSKGGKGGFVVNTASIAGFLPHPGIPVYVASKHAVVGLTRSYGHAHYFDKEGVMFFALCPSYINTELLQDVENRSLMEGLDTTQRKDIMTPDFVAQGVIKLLQDKINGSTLVVEKDFGLKYVGLPKELEGLSID